MMITQAAPAQSLPELYARALDADPSVRAAEASMRAAEQRLYQAKAAFGPTATFTANGTRNDYREEPDDDKRLLRSEQYVVQINQPVLRAALQPALQAAQAQFEQAQSALQQSRLEARQRVSEALLEVFKTRDVLAHAAALRETQREQLAAARRSYQVGRSAITEVRDAQARADSAQAQWIAAEAELDVRQQVLAEIAAGPTPDLLGKAVVAPAMPSASDNPEPPVPIGLPALKAGSVLEWLSGAESESPQMRQARFALEAADAEVRKASLAHTPTLDLNYSYTRSRDTGTVTSFFPRRGNSSAFGATLTVPLFASGATQSKVVEAEALRSKAQGELDFVRRTLVIGVRQAFAAALSAIAQARALTTAETSQALSVRANQRGYEVGVKVNADVLEAQSRLFEARRDLSKARHDAWAGYFKLRALVGLLGDDDVRQLDAQLIAHKPGDMGRSRGPGR